VWRDAADLAETAATQVRYLADTDPSAASDIAHATGTTLAATAHVLEGRRGGPITEAARIYDRAGRELHGRLPRPTPVAHSLRSMARLISQTGRARRDETAQVLALVTNLAALSDAVGELRQAQQRLTQACAAREAGERLRHVATPPAPPSGSGPAVAVHTARIPLVVHTLPAGTRPPTSSHRKVQL
jgi:hypothetical protein